MFLIFETNPSPQRRYQLIGTRDGRIYQPQFVNWSLQHFGEGNEIRSVVHIAKSDGLYLPDANVIPELSLLAIRRRLNKELEVHDFSLQEIKILMRSIQLYKRDPDHCLWASQQPEHAKLIREGLTMPAPLRPISLSTLRYLNVKAEFSGGGRGIDPANSSVAAHTWHRTSGNRLLTATPTQEYKIN